MVTVQSVFRLSALAADTVFSALYILSQILLLSLMQQILMCIKGSAVDLADADGNVGAVVGNPFEVGHHTERIKPSSIVHFPL